VCVQLYYIYVVWIINKINNYHLAVQSTLQIKLFLYFSDRLITDELIEFISEIQPVCISLSVHDYLKPRLCSSCTIVTVQTCG